MQPTTRISDPHDPLLVQLEQQLLELSPELDRPGSWPTKQLELCRQYGVYEWFAKPQWGGQDWSAADVIRGYLALSRGCLTTAFILTQRTGAYLRLENSANQLLKERLVPPLVRGESFATVGISHLTTSRRHVGQPVLRATATKNGYLLNGYTPWVTGGRQAETIVVGATSEEGLDILFALPTDAPGVTVPEPPAMVGLSASQTGPVTCQQVHLSDEQIIAGPAPELMKQGGGATGGLQTSTLAIGLAQAALRYLRQESLRRSDLTSPWEALHESCEALETCLLQAAEQRPVCSNEELRSRANSLVLRATQAALAAAKGTGYVWGHPAGRWCREALFFLVWSCPQPVIAANLCEFAGKPGTDDF